MKNVARLPATASAHLLAVQVAALLLRLSGTSKLTHVLRTNPPELSAAAARDFDEAVLKAYEVLAALDPLTPQQRDQCQLPLSLGGRVLRSEVRTAAAAWIWSWASCGGEGAHGLAHIGRPRGLYAPPARHCRSPGSPSWTELSNRPMAQAERTSDKRTNQQLNPSWIRWTPRVRQGAVGRSPLLGNKWRLVTQQSASTTRSTR